jgi:hypothetical protein
MLALYPQDQQALVYSATQIIGTSIQAGSLGSIPTWANREALEFATPTAQKIK